MLLLLYLILIPTGLVLPVLWILRSWLQERAVRTSLGLTGLICHLLLFCFLVATNPIYLLVYCGFILLAIAMQPIINPRSEWRARSKMAEEDIARYKRKLERFPENAALHSALAKVYMDCRQYDDAIKEYQAAIDLDPDHSRSEVWRLEEAQMAKARADRRLFRKGSKPEMSDEKRETSE